jgi:hypothetical protein
LQRLRASTKKHSWLSGLARAQAQSALAALCWHTTHDMPLYLEDESGNAAGGLDAATATTLFWRPIPVLLKQPDREDSVETLTFRILSGVTRNNHNLRVSRVCVCACGVRRAPRPAAATAAPTQKNTRPTTNKPLHN